MVRLLQEGQLKYVFAPDTTQANTCSRPKYNSDIYSPQIQPTEISQKNTCLPTGYQCMCWMRYRCNKWSRKMVFKKKSSCVWRQLSAVKAAAHHTCKCIFSLLCALVATPKTAQTGEKSNVYDKTAAAADGGAVPLNSR